MGRIVGPSNGERTEPPALRRETEALLEAMDGWPLGIVVTDTELDEPGPRIVYANAAFSEMVGLPVASIMGRSPRFLQGPATSRTELDRLRLALRERTRFVGETINYRADGTPFVMQWTVSPVFDATGELVSYFALQRDVTVERRLRAIADAKSMSESLGMVLAGARHELANPLGAARAGLELLRRERDPAHQRELVELVDAELHRVEQFLDKLRTFNALEVASPEPVAVRAFLDDFVAKVGFSVRAQGVDIRFSIGPQVHEIAADPRALFQVLVNLVNNALGAHASQPEADEKEIVVSAERDDEGATVIDVVDNGPGIESEDLPRVFDPFFTTKPTGTGLGLSIVQKMAADMGARVSARSARRTAESRGRTSFRLLFPPHPSREA